MADQTAAPATAEDRAPVSSGNATSSQTPSSATLPELLSQDSFDIEDAIAALSPVKETATQALDEPEPQEDDGPTPEETNPTTDEGTALNPEDDPDQVLDEALKDGAKPKTARRMAKLLEQRNAALAAERKQAERIAELEAQVGKAIDIPAPVVNSQDPLATVVTTEELAKAETNAKAWRNWCLRNMMGGTPPMEGAEELTSEQVADYLIEAEERLAAIPQRKVFLASYQENQDAVRKSMPAMFQTGTPEAAAKAKYEKQLQQFSLLPNQAEIIAKLIKLDAQEAEEKAGIAKYTRVVLNSKAGTTTTTTQQPVARSAAPKVPAIRSTAAVDAKSTAWQKLQEPRGSVDLEELLNS